MLTAEQERLCMLYNPFDGGKGDSNERILSDKMLTARKLGPCCICGETIQKGERVRKQAAVVDGDMCSCRICEACCVAAAVSWDDFGGAIERRTAMGMVKAGSLPPKALNIADNAL